MHKLGNWLIACWQEAVISWPRNGPKNSVSGHFHYWTQWTHIAIHDENEVMLLKALTDHHDCQRCRAPLKAVYVLHPASWTPCLLDQWLLVPCFLCRSSRRLKIQGQKMTAPKRMSGGMQDWAMTDLFEQLLKRIVGKMWTFVVFCSTFILQI